MSIPGKVVSRIMEARKRKGRKDLTYVVWNKRGFEEGTFCFLCRGQIRGRVEDEEPIRTEVLGGRTVVYKALILASFPRYVEVKFELDDGSFHVTSLCRRCAERLTLEEANDVYVSDLDQWWDDEKSGRGATRWDVVGGRKPVKVVEIGNQVI